MSKIQAVTVMTLDGFLPETDNVLTQWVMNHRKGFVHWRVRCNARILPHSILDLLCEKDSKSASFTYLAEVDEFIVYLFPYSTGKGNSVQDILPPRQWQLHKVTTFSNGICRLIYRNPCRM